MTDIRPPRSELAALGDAASAKHPGSYPDRSVVEKSVVVEVTKMRAHCSVVGVTTGGPASHAGNGVPCALGPRAAALHGLALLRAKGPTAYQRTPSVP